MRFDNRKYRAVLIPTIWVVLMASVHLIQVLTNLPIYKLGVYPRFFSGLKGIVFAPFIHGDLGHLFFNMMPLFALGLIIYYFYPRVATRSMLMIYFLTGISVWAFGGYNYHIGASGVVYGMVSFVFWTGVFRRNLKSIVLALVILFFYQGMFSGLIPKEGVSWESHLYGALAGIFAAFFYKDHIEEDEIEQIPSWEKEGEPDQKHFLPRDIFEKTKAQRAAELRDQSNDGWTSSNT